MKGFSVDNFQMMSKPNVPAPMKVASNMNEYFQTFDEEEEDEDAVFF